MSDELMKMTDNTAKCVAAALATPSQWKIIAKRLVHKVKSTAFAKDRRFELVQLLLFLQNTEANWRCDSFFVATLRYKLWHFYKIDKWEPAGYFERAFFPEQTRVAMDLS
jgi:hypothetical protein